MEARRFRINMRDMPHDAARTELSRTRRQTGTESKPTITSPDKAGNYQIVIDDWSQLDLFLLHLRTNRIKFEELKGNFTVKTPSQDPEFDPLKIVSDLADMASSFLKGFNK